MRLTCPVALRTGCTLLPSGYEFAAYRWPLRVDRTGCIAAHFAIQRDAAWAHSIGTTHGYAMSIELCGQCFGHNAAKQWCGFGPVKGHSKVGATGAAAQAWVTHVGILYAPLGARRRGFYTGYRQAGRQSHQIVVKAAKPATIAPISPAEV